MKIVILDAHTTNPGDLSWEPLEQLGQLTVFPRTTPNQLAERIADAEAIILNKTVMNAEAFELAPRLRYIGVLATTQGSYPCSFLRLSGAITPVAAYPA